MPKPIERRERNRESDARRNVDQPWRKLYSQARWLALRLRVFIRDDYTCKMCKRAVARPHADHIKEHKGDLTLFFDEANVQTLCPMCHNADKQRMEHGGNARIEVDARGWPI